MYLIKYLADPKMAQIHPYKFTTAILSFAQQRGLQLIKGKCTSLHTTSVRYTTETGPAELPADVIVIAAGPWTPSLVKDIEIKASRAHSVVIKPKALLPAQAVFFSYETQEGPRTQPEVYSRPSEVYVSGQMDSRRPLPDLAKDVMASEKEISSLESAAKELSTKLADGVIETRQACYLPLYDRGFPAVGWHTRPRPKKAGIFGSGKMLG